MAIKVMCQNVMCWEHKELGRYEDRRPLMKKAVLEHGADVIGFQEVKPIWKEFFDVDLNGFDSMVVYRSESRKEGTPIYWNPQRLEKRDSGYFWLSETPQVESLGWGANCPRITCWILFLDKQSQKEFVLVNTHLDHQSEDARVNGIKQISDFIKSKFSNEIPLVLMGDFNATPNSETIKTANSILTDCRQAVGITEFEPTYHGFEKQANLVIDYIYINDNVKCRDFEMIKEINGKTVQSDHYGLIATIEI